MPIWDRTVSNVNSQIGKIWDKTVSGAESKIGRAWDYTAGGIASPVFISEVTVSNWATNNGTPGLKYSWSDNATVAYNLDVGTVPNQRCWIRIAYGGWSYGGAEMTVRHQGNLVSGPVSLNGGNTNWKTGVYENIVEWNWASLVLVTGRYGASQGQSGLVENVLIVPTAPVDQALGRQASQQEMYKFFGHNWAGSKTIQI